MTLAFRYLWTHRKKVDNLITSGLILQFIKFFPSRLVSFYIFGTHKEKVDIIPNEYVRCPGPLED